MSTECGETDEPLVTDKEETNAVADQSCKVEETGDSKDVAAENTDANVNTAEIGEILENITFESNCPINPENLDEGLEFFNCNVCGMHEMCYFFDLGYLPLGISAGTFCILDPFSQVESNADPSNPASFDDVIVMGGICSVCGCSVCVDATCSIFFQQTFCRDCALHEPNREMFPAEVIQNLLDNIRKREESRKKQQAQSEANKSEVEGST